MDRMISTPWDDNNEETDRLIERMDDGNIHIMPSKILSPAENAEMIRLQKIYDMAVLAGIEEESALRIAGMSEKPTPPPSQTAAFGSNESVYNPYDPLASKEYIAQQIAAERIEELDSVQEPLQPRKRSRGRPHKPFNRLSNPNVQVMTPTAITIAQTRMAGHGHDLRSSSFGSAASKSSEEEHLGNPLVELSNEESSRPEVQQYNDCSENAILNEIASELDSNCPSAPPPSPTLVNSKIAGETSAFHSNVIEKAYGTLEASYPILGAVKLQNMVKAVGSKRLAEPESDSIRATSKTTWRLPIDGRAYPTFVSMQTPNGLPDRKRRRTDTSPEGALPTAPPTGKTDGHLLRPKVFGRRASTGNPRSQGPFSSHAVAPWLVDRTVQEIRLRFEASRDLLEPIRLNIERKVNPQSSILDTANTSSSPLLPPRQHLSSQSLFFTSELLPSSFISGKRQRVLNILRTNAPYLPACVRMAPSGLKTHYFIAPTTIAPPVQCSLEIPQSHGPPDPEFGPHGKGWTSGALPVEVFRQIASSLPVAALKAMRLVNHEFESKVSNIVFDSVVVSFRPEIYGMMVRDTKPRDPFDLKGKGKENVFTHTVTDQNVHDGMKVFQAWGPHIKKFAMAFELSQDQLMEPPLKDKFEQLSAWWGLYNWPHPDYRRFEYCANLEKKADEFRCMSAALANLQQIQELGLCIDSGLGWLEGPDISDRARLFKQKAQVFGTRAPQLTAQHLDAQETWERTVYSVRSKVYHLGEDTHTFSGKADYPGFMGEHYDPGKTYEGIEVWVFPRGLGHPRLRVESEKKCLPRPLVFGGTDLSFNDDNILDEETWDCRNRSKASTNSPFSAAPILPNQLTDAQKEWLLETEWAQRAFLSSYCMALADNSNTFRWVYSLNIAKISSTHLSDLQRHDFWTALPNLNKLNLIVVPDFRRIFTNEAGLVEAADLQPSEAATQFYTLLDMYVAKVKGIKSMRLGYHGGGEHQTGIFGRNQLVLPAPISNYTDQKVFTQGYKMVLRLPYVEDLTLCNCWIAPPILKTFTISNSRSVGKLRSLTLDSVSLSAHSGVKDSSEPDPLGNGVSRYASLPWPRLNDPYLGHKFFSRRPSGSDPRPASGKDLWIYTLGRVGSWPNVIDAITPGPTLDLVRYAFRYREEVPRIRKPSTLQQISFISCGYVRLNNSNYPQQSLPNVSYSTPGGLRNRVHDLKAVMMHRPEDKLLGQIVPGLPDLDLNVFETGFPMRIGWEDNDSKYQANYEDGQPEGGRGRFTGCVKRSAAEEEAENI